MIKKVLDIIDKNFIKVNILRGVRQVQNIFYEQNTECFVAYDYDRPVGVVTKRQLVGAHPNRIIADVMSDKYICVDSYSGIWEAKEIFDLNSDIEVILVKDGSEIIGYITRTILNIELGKHIDLLTGLYKSNYMFSNAYKLIKRGENATIIFIDLNNFGYIDKKYGHINGDAILKSVAEILKEIVPSASYLCRYAGDEFTILTPYSIDDSMVLAKKIINAISLYEYPNNIKVSASIGITGYKVHNKQTDDITALINELVNIASLASTKAKHNVNNSIIIEKVDIDAIA